MLFELNKSATNIYIRNVINIYVCETRFLVHLRIARKIRVCWLDLYSSHCFSENICVHFVKEAKRTIPNQILSDLNRKSHKLSPNNFIVLKTIACMFMCIFCTHVCHNGNFKLVGRILRSFPPLNALYAIATMCM